MPRGVPVNQRVAPDGTVTSDFEGHLHADGVDLDAGTSASAPSDRKIRWLSANGAMVAELSGYEDGTGGQGNARLRATGPPGGIAGLEVGFTGGDVAPGDFIYVIGPDNNGHNGAVFASSNAFAVDIIRSDGTSDFMFSTAGIPATFGANWDSYSPWTGTYRQPVVATMGKLVVVNGVATNTASFAGSGANATILTDLPAPPRRQILSPAVVGRDGTTDTGIARLDVFPDGTLQYIQSWAGSFANIGGIGTWVALDFAYLIFP